ncbi:hypothetical protein CMO88_02675 [Candidatus Woesearchaeota archaeon]|nr:hypothetical protein [Candidatus Woesearchaeota archaeon]
MALTVSKEINFEQRVNRERRRGTHDYILGKRLEIIGYRELESDWTIEGFLRQVTEKFGLPTAEDHDQPYRFFDFIDYGVIRITPETAHLVDPIMEKFGFTPGLTVSEMYRTPRDVEAAVNIMSDLANLGQLLYTESVLQGHDLARTEPLERSTEIHLPAVNGTKPSVNGRAYTPIEKVEQVI